MSPAAEAKLVSNFLFPHQTKLGLTSKASPESHSESILWVRLHPSLHRCHSERHRPKSRMSSEKHEVKTVIKIDSRVTSSVVAGRVTRRSKCRRNPVSVRSHIFDRPPGRIRQEYLPAILCRSIIGMSTHCGHELGKPRLRPLASTFSHLSGLGKTPTVFPLPHRQPSLSRKHGSNASAGGTWVNCYIAVRAPMANVHHTNVCRLMVSTTVQQSQETKLPPLRQHVPRVGLRCAAFWASLLFEHHSPDVSKRSKTSP